MISLQKRSEHSIKIAGWVPIPFPQYLWTWVPVLSQHWASSCSALQRWTLCVPAHCAPSSQGMGETPLQATMSMCVGVCGVGWGWGGSLCNTQYMYKDREGRLYSTDVTSRTISLLTTVPTLKRKSFGRHGSWNSFLACFPAVKLMTFRQSNSLSIISTNLAVSMTSGLCVSTRALATELLST